MDCRCFGLYPPLHLSPLWHGQQGLEGDVEERNSAEEYNNGSGGDSQAGKALW